MEELTRNQADAKKLEFGQIKQGIKNLEKAWEQIDANIESINLDNSVKYVTKRDEANPEFNGKIFASKGIGKDYINKNSLRKHRYRDRFTEETYRTSSGVKVALPTYYKQKIRTVQEREALRIIKEEEQVKYYNKTPIKVETIEQYKEYVNAVKYWQSIKNIGNIGIDYKIFPLIIQANISHIISLVKLPLHPTVFHLN